MGIKYNKVKHFYTTLLIHYYYHQTAIYAYYIILINLENHIKQKWLKKFLSSKYFGC